MWQNCPKLLAQKGEYGANHGLPTVTRGGVRALCVCELNANNAIFDTQHNQPPPHHRFTPQSVNTHTNTQQTITHTHTAYTNTHTANTYMFVDAHCVLTRVLLSFWILPSGDTFGNYLAAYFVVYLYSIFAVFLSCLVAHIFKSLGRHIWNYITAYFVV